MIAKLDLRQMENENKSPFGMKLDPKQQEQIQRKLDSLAERAPANAAIQLHLEQRKDCVRGTLSITSFSKTFTSTQVSSNPVLTYLLLEGDLDHQLLRWKRSRFSEALAGALGRENVSAKATMPRCS